ncbi:MAG: hypothetical protein QOD99_1129 [Chthoniobacter sp.]|nr:hypothetical protein [Chthoniobacter sp.]
MNERNEAEEHLRVIRTLMERATIYRAVSAPTALVGGMLAVVIATGSLMWLRNHPRSTAVPHFALWWILALCITSAANTFYLWRAARLRGEPLFSSSLRLAVRALFPPCLTAAVISLPSILAGRDSHLLAIVWSAFYGLALLATAHFSPRSLVVLGWSFLLAALFALAANHACYPKYIGAEWLMGITFGLFHLVYAVAAWPRKTA